MRMEAAAKTPMRTGETVSRDGSRPRWIDGLLEDEDVSRLQRTSIYPVRVYSGRVSIQSRFVFAVGPSIVAVSASSLADIIVWVLIMSLSFLPQL